MSNYWIIIFKVKGDYGLKMLVNILVYSVSEVC